MKAIASAENSGFYAQNGWLGAFYYNYPRPLARAARTYGDEAFTQEVCLASNTEGSVDYMAGFYCKWRPGFRLQSG